LHFVALFESYGCLDRSAAISSAILFFIRRLLVVEPDDAARGRALGSDAGLLEGLLAAGGAWVGAPSRGVRSQLRGQLHLPSSRRDAGRSLASLLSQEVEMDKPGRIRLWVLAASILCTIHCAGEVDPLSTDATVGREASAVDRSTPQELAAATDLGLTSYGQTCAKGSVTKCPDGVAECIPSWNPSSRSNYCSMPCKGFGDACPRSSLDTEFGVRNECVFTVDKQMYCVFVCLMEGTSYPCPKGFECLPTLAPGYEYCWPK
jgi:hypothetical protein